MSFAAVASKTGIKGALSLTAMAQHMLIKRVHEIVSFQDAPINIIAPILRQVSDPGQLRALEIESPQILDLTPELWQSMIRRDIPDWERKMMRPKDPASWWKVYRKLKRDDDAARQAAEEKLKATLSAAASHRRDHATLVLHAVLPEERQSIGYLDKGVRHKDAGRNALNNLKRASSHHHMAKATLAKATPTNLRLGPVHSTPSSFLSSSSSSSSSPSSLPRGLSKIQSAVRAAPRSMHSGPTTPAAPTTGPRRFTPSAAASAPLSGRISKSQYRSRPAARNPFRPGCARSNIRDMHVEALNLAVKLELESDAGRRVESERKLAAIRAAQSSRALGRQQVAEGRKAAAMQAGQLVVAAAVAALGKEEAGQQVREGGAGNELMVACADAGAGATTTTAAAATTTERRPSPVAAAGAGAHASSPPVGAGVVVKRKAPNIFMAPKKARRAC